MIPKDLYEGLQVELYFKTEPPLELPTILENATKGGRNIN